MEKDNDKMMEMSKGILEVFTKLNTHLPYDQAIYFLVFINVKWKFMFTPRCIHKC